MLCFVHVARVEEAFVELSQAAEELGDVPDRYMCPIGCDIMRDPVTLPTSGQVMNLTPYDIDSRSGSLVETGYSLYDVWRDLNREQCAGNEPIP